MSDTPITDSYQNCYDGRFLEAMEKLERENATLRKNMAEMKETDETEAAIAADTIKSLKAENTGLRAKVAAQGLSLACLADGILGEDAADRSDQALVRFGCQLARERDALRAALDAQMQYQRDLRADRDRLDWLDHMANDIMCAGDEHGITIGAATNFQNYATNGITFRAAIDAARKEAQP